MAESDSCSRVPKLQATNACSQVVEILSLVQLQRKGQLVVQLVWLGLFAWLDFFLLDTIIAGLQTEQIPHEHRRAIGGDQSQAIGRETRPQN